MKVGGLALLGLLLPSIASAATGGRRGSTRVCGPTFTLRKLTRVANSLSGPIARPAAHTLLGLSDGGVLLQRGTRAARGDDDAAIQNDAPAAWVEPDAGLAFALEPIGLLARVCVRQPKTHDFSPRSPRGPPVAG